MTQERGNDQHRKDGRIPRRETFTPSEIEGNSKDGNDESQQEIVKPDQPQKVEADRRREHHAEQQAVSPACVPAQPCDGRNEAYISDRHHQLRRRERRCEEKKEGQQPMSADIRKCDQIELMHLCDPRISPNHLEYHPGRVDMSRPVLVHEILNAPDRGARKN